MKKNISLCLAALAALTVQTGCLSVKTEHEVKPIHITMDVNLKVDSQIEKAMAANDKPSIKSLLERGLIGLGNQSVLAPRGAISADEMEILVKANSDYKTHVAKIAEENGITVDEALKRGAAKFMERAPAGAWYQKEDGTWEQKK